MNSTTSPPGPTPRTRRRVDGEWDDPTWLQVEVDEYWFEAQVRKADGEAGKQARSARPVNRGRWRLKALSAALTDTPQTVTELAHTPDPCGQQGRPTSQTRTERAERPPRSMYVLTPNVSAATPQGRDQTPQE